MHAPGGTQASLRQRSYFPWLALALLLFVLTGFARTFFLHGLFGMPAPQAFIAFHGVLMTGWVALLVLQASLVAAGQLRWHRRLGVLGVCWAALIVPVGCAATLLAAARELRAGGPFVAAQLTVLSLELTQMLLFGALVTWAVRLRARPDWHKRLMVVATVGILPNVIVRLMMLLPTELLRNDLALVLWTALLAGVIGLDVRRTGGLHPAYARAGTAALAAMLFAYLLGISAGWQRFASWLVS
jgi:hypothetical protein